MADIFVSYARHDQARVAPLVAALERQGWSVWWDPEITPGQEFDDCIAEEIEKARAVIVVWTPTSVASRWVRGEAREAADRGILVPVRFENAKLPIDARSLHTTELDHWGENPESAEFRQLLRALKSHLAVEPVRGDVRVTPNGDDAISIAVLPFVNMSSDPEQDYFSDGLSEELINQLVKIKRLHVTGRTSSFAFKGRTDDLRLIGNKLGVNHVLEGSVRKAGNRLRIAAQLIKCGDGFHLWSETFDRELDDVFAIQDEVAGAVAQALGVTLRLGEAAPAPAPITSLEAYDRYLRAVTLRNSVVPSELSQAVALLRETLALDPGFAPAHAALVGTYALMLIFAPERVEQTLKEMSGAVQDALSRIPDHWGGHLANGISLLQGADWLSADVALARAHALSPPSELLPSLYRSVFLGSVGRCSEALRVLEAARAVDPLSAMASTMLQQELDNAGRPDEAQAEYERTRDLPGTLEVPEHQALLRLWERGDPVAIRAQAQCFFDKQVVPMPVLKEIYQVFDQPPVARSLIRQAFEDPGYQDATRLMILGLYAAHFRDEALALAATRRAYVDKRGTARALLWHPALGNARQTDDFKRLLRDMGFYDYWRASGHWGDFVKPQGADDFEVIK